MRRVLVVAACLALGACRIDEGADVAAYRAVLDGRSAAPAALEPGAALDLGAAMRLANAQDEFLAQEGEAYVRTLIERDRRVAAFLPRIALLPTLFARERTSASTDPRGADLEASLGLSFNPAVDARRLSAADLEILARKQRLLTAQEDLLLDVGRAWYLIHAAEERRAVLRASLVVQEARVADARARAAAGLRRPLDVALAESRAADARARIVDADSEARNARLLLGFLCGVELFERPLGREPKLGTESTKEDELFARARSRRPEPAAADYEVAAAEAQVEAAYGAYWPSLALDLGVFFVRDSEPTELDWTSALRISIPLFEAGLIEADVREALSRLRAAKSEAARLRRLVEHEIRVALENLRAVEARRTELLVREQAARSAYDLAVAQEGVGLASNLERLTAQDDLLSVELELAESRVEQRLRALELARAVGDLKALAGLDPEAAPDA